MFWHATQMVLNQLRCKTKWKNVKCPKDDVLIHIKTCKCRKRNLCGKVVAACSTHHSSNNPWTTRSKRHGERGTRWYKCISKQQPPPPPSPTAALFTLLLWLIIFLISLCPNNLRGRLSLSGWWKGTRAACDGVCTTDRHPFRGSMGPEKTSCAC